MTKSVFKGFGEISLGGGDVSPALGPGSCDRTNRFVLRFSPLVYKINQLALISEFQHKLN